MKTIFILLLVFLESCGKPTYKKNLVGSSATSGLTKIEGSWELCTASGGTDGDYKITNVISGNTFYFTEYYYSSHDGSCTNPIVRTAGVQTITEGSGNNLGSPDAIAIDLTFTAPLVQTALTGDAEAMVRVSSCTNEMAPSLGVAYNVTKANCGYVPLFFVLVVAGQKGYTVFYTNATNPKSISIGDSFSSTSDTRAISFNSTQFFKK